jgi:hypothetical protein
VLLAGLEIARLLPPVKEIMVAQEPGTTVLRTTQEAVVVALRRLGAVPQPVLG